MSIKNQITKYGIEPLYLSDSEGKKIAVVLKIEEFQQIMSKLSENGVDFQVSSKKPAAGFANTEAEVIFDEGETDTKEVTRRPLLFEMQDEFLSAQGILLPDGKCFKVLAGSKASGIVDKRLPQSIQNIREELIMLRVLDKDTVQGDMVFIRDYEFDDPSIAASTIAASPRNGLVCWIDLASGKPMGKLHLH
jgi:hypothetical protein